MGYNLLGNLASLVQPQTECSVYLFILLTGPDAAVSAKYKWSLMALKKTTQQPHTHCSCFSVSVFIPPGGSRTLPRHICGSCVIF